MPAQTRIIHFYVCLGAAGGKECEVIMMRLGDCFFNGIGTEVDNKQALKYYQLAEQMYYERLESGDFLIKNCYKHILRNQEEARQRLNDVLPGYEWTK